MKKWPKILTPSCQRITFGNDFDGTHPNLAIFLSDSNEIQGRQEPHYVTKFLRLIKENVKNSLPMGTTVKSASSKLEIASIHWYTTLQKVIEHFQRRVKTVPCSHNLQSTNLLLTPLNKCAFDISIRCFIKLCYRPQPWW